ncbi:MAG TPA: hypothetical protein VHX65_09495 [Pirellulales bacterium]|nr:hypothetical protein [Pirellulales bacterium]
MLRILSLLREWKHLTLLATLLALIFAQPIAQRGTAGLVVFDLLLTAVTAVIFFVVFERRSTRTVALLLAAPMICVHWFAHAVSPNNTVLLIVDRAAGALFLGFAVTVVLRGIFQPKQFRTDDLLGVVCGYLLTGLAWGNAYNLADAISPNAFQVKSEVAWQLKDQTARRHLFDNFSFVTLTCEGDAKVVPISQTASSLTWLEAVFGQFYMAVVVAQLVGLKLSQAAANANERDD